MGGKCGGQWDQILAGARTCVQRSKGGRCACGAWRGAKRRKCVRVCARKNVERMAGVEGTRREAGDSSALFGQYHTQLYATATRIIRCRRADAAW